MLLSFNLRIFPPKTYQPNGNTKKIILHNLYGLCFNSSTIISTIHSSLDVIEPLCDLVCNVAAGRLWRPGRCTATLESCNNLCQVHPGKDMCCGTLCVQLGWLRPAAAAVSHTNLQTGSRIQCFTTSAANVIKLETGGRPLTAVQFSQSAGSAWLAQRAMVFNH